jgi:ABC-type Fe3+ transport system permease subunit
MNRLKSIVLSLALVLGLGVFAAAPTGAINVFKGCNGTNSNTTVCNAKDSDDANTLIQAIVNTLLFAVAAISVIMIIVGGIRYASSNGDASRVTSGKNTVLYSVIGLVVAMLAYAIVNFVITNFE